jgi:hypothetical protein
VGIAKWLNRVPYAGIIIPLRGGLKPGIQLRLLTELQHECCWLPFTRGSNKVDHEQVRHLLKRFLERIATVPVLRIAILDTADSGDSARVLAEIIRDIYRSMEGPGQWIANFMLIFEPRDDGYPFPPKALDIRKLTLDERLIFSVTVCQTPSLIVEDWDEAIGIRTIWKDGKVPAIVQLPSKGRIIVEEFSGNLLEIEAERLDHYTNDLFTSAVSEAMTTDPMFRFDHDVWQNYVVGKR